MSSRYLLVLLLGAVLFAAPVLSEEVEREHKHNHKHQPGSRRLLETAEVEDSHHHPHHPHEHILVEEVEKEGSHKKLFPGKKPPPHHHHHHPHHPGHTLAEEVVADEKEKEHKYHHKHYKHHPSDRRLLGTIEVEDLHHRHRHRHRHCHRHRHRHHPGHMLAEEVVADERNKPLPDHKPPKKVEEPKKGMGEKPHHHKPQHKPPTEN